MNVYEWIFLIVASTFLAIAVLVAFVESLLGTDLKTFESLRTTSPKKFRNLKWVGRINGPMIAIMGAVGLFASVFFSNHSSSILLTICMFVVSAIFLWLSVRWFLWSLRA